MVGIMIFGDSKSLTSFSEAAPRRLGRDVGDEGPPTCLSRGTQQLDLDFVFICDVFKCFPAFTGIVGGFVSLNRRP